MGDDSFYLYFILSTRPDFLLLTRQRVLLTDAKQTDVKGSYGSASQQLRHQFATNTGKNKCYKKAATGNYEAFGSIRS